MAGRFLIGLIVWFSNTLVMYAQESSYRLFAENGVVNQSATNWGKYLFIFTDKMASILLYDLEQKNVVYTLKLTPHAELNNNISVYHCNQCHFGKEKYDENDFFPLLYVCQRSKNGPSPAFMNVLRVLPQFDGTRKITSFSIKEVQRIQFPIMTDQNCMGNPCVVIDQKGGFLYTYSRNYNKAASNYNCAVFSKFRIPSLEKRGDSTLHQVFLNDSDILDSFLCDFSLVNVQGGFFRKGKIYLVQGYPSGNPDLNYVYFREIDIKKRKQVRFVDMLADGFKEEPEGCWYYNKTVMISTYGNNFYSLHGKQFKVK
jgi:hypothetical protein